MNCTNTYTFDDPEEFDDNETVAERIPLPYIIDCENDVTQCEDLWQNQLCGSDSMYYQPLLPGDRIHLQTRFFDSKNPPNSACKPPLKPGYSVGSMLIVDPPPPTQLFGNAARLAEKDVLLNVNFYPFIPCHNVGDILELTTGFYPDWESWRAGILNFLLAYPWAGSPTKYPVYDDTNTLIGIKLEWLNSAFFSVFGYNPCDEVELLMCWHKWKWDNFYNARVVEINTSLPHPDIAIIPFQCCPEKPPCFGLTTDPNGCSIPSGFGRAKFEINDLSYYYGTDQNTFNAGDAGIYFAIAGDSCPSTDAVVNSLLLLSNATDFADYVANIESYINSFILGGGSSVSVALGVGTASFTILFDKAWHLANQDWDVCTVPMKICDIRYPKNDYCTPTEFKEVSIILTSFVPSGGTTSVAIYSSECGLGVTLTGIVRTSLEAYLTSIRDAFNAYPLGGGSYAVLIDSDFGLSGIDGIKFFFKLTAFDGICNCNKWYILDLTVPSANSKIYRKNICCVANCAENEVGYASFDFFIHDDGFAPSMLNEIQIQYRCGLGLPYSNLHTMFVVSDFVFTISNLIDEIILKLNDVQYQITIGLPAGTYAIRYGSRLRLKIPEASLPCDCKEIDMRISVNQTIAP